MGVTRCTAICQGKGGVGKTSITANIAGLAAAAGLKTLVLDLDQQGNLARDLGMPLDSGERLFIALRNGGKLPVVHDVRPNLDVVPGGHELGDISGMMVGRAMGGGATLTTTLRTSLDRIADEYQLILIDTPPGEQVVVEAALGVASAVLIPTRADDASLDGMSLVAKRFAAARGSNPGLRLAGVLLFAIGTQGHRLEAATRAKILGIISDPSLTFAATVRHSDSAAVDSRTRGLLAHELEGAVAKDRTDRLAALRKGEPLPAGLLNRNATGLAADYEAVTRELLTRLAQIEKEEVFA